jgi:hypothetical protein
MGKSEGFICSPHLYRYQGLLIEERPIGPRWWPCKADGKPYERLPRVVKARLNDWYAMPDAGRVIYHIGGGCERIGGTR